MITNLTKLDLFDQIDAIRDKRIRNSREYETMTFLRRLAAKHTENTGLHTVLSDPLASDAGEKS